MSARRLHFSRGGFTLVELLVSMAVLLLMLITLVQITNSTQRIWTSTTGKVEQFRDAREAFEAVTRRLSQALLNTYWDYSTGTGGGTSPQAYVRQSELRFLSGPGLAGNAGSTPPRPTHSVFFQAPLGFTAAATYQSLQNSLNTVGYFIEFAGDSDSRPPFYNNLNVPPRYRFRLMEMMEPSESLSLYTFTGSAGANGAPANLHSRGWFETPLANAARRRVVAENIVALVFLPKLSSQEDTSGVQLCPNYSYDSTKTDDADDATVAANLNWKNQLPPMVQVTMVAVDDPSFNRLQVGATMPDYTSNLFASAANCQADLDQLQANLLGKPFVAGAKTYTPQGSAHPSLTYRIFTTNVSIKSAKWSRSQTN